MSQLTQRMLDIINDMVNEMDAALGDVGESIMAHADPDVPVRDKELVDSAFSVKGVEPGTWTIGYNSDHAAVIHSGKRLGKEFKLHNGKAQFLAGALEDAKPTMLQFLASRVQAVMTAS